ncbi:Flagellar P-ring protein FlgI [hydrothermal vent metagenome]|uniref:Flagellar P-ring protein FlgI n=1 Tax=hydrothermal vent metagenome TaxID=652676 RepID=A0A3B1A1V0_9ZZZZ
MLKLNEIKHIFIIGLVLLFLVHTGTLKAERLKDITHVAGVRENQLIGYGLVIGLNGTGDSTNSAPFTEQSIKSLISRLGVTIPGKSRVSIKNVAAVIIHAQLPAFSKKGQKIDITVSSIGDAKSLRGGTLIMSPLKGVDDKIYAIAQGNVIVNGFGVDGGDGSSITVNIPSVGRIPNGATIENTIETPFGKETELVLNLNTADFTTSIRITKIINEVMGPNTARSIDASSVHVNAPQERNQRVSFIAMLENLQVKPGKAPARVIVNSRSGTVVIGEHVRVLPAAISHGSLTLTISENTAVSQPNALADGDTVVVPQSTVSAGQKLNRMFLFEPGVSLNDIVRAINEVGVSPGDLVSILEALKEAGALRAELIVI